MPRAVLVALALLLGACGQQTSVTVHHVPQADIVAAWGTEGHTHWDGEGNCEIWIAPIDWYLEHYPDAERHYHWLLGHEFDHCLRGHYHPPGEGNR